MEGHATGVYKVVYYAGKQLLECKHNLPVHEPCGDDDCQRPHEPCNSPSCLGAHGNTVGSRPASAKYCQNGPAIFGEFGCKAANCPFNHLRSIDEFREKLGRYPNGYTRPISLEDFVVKPKEVKRKKWRKVGSDSVPRTSAGRASLGSSRTSVY